MEDQEKLWTKADKDALRVFGQLILFALFLLSTGLILYTRTPGNGSMTDADQIILAPVYAVFLITFLSIILNAILMLSKNKWPTYRKVTIGVAALALIACLIWHSAILKFGYGTVKYTAETSNQDVTVQMKLYENGKFLVTTYDVAYLSENTGHYTFINDTLLTLQYKQKIADYLCRTYIVKDTMMICPNNTYYNYLKFKKIGSK